jgi:cysteine desulfurase/selenocysteine lyase
MYESEFILDESIAYLNHAAVSPWPVCTQRAVTAFAGESARQGASMHYDAWIATEQALREQLRRMINAQSSEEIALLKNTSEALSVVAHGLRWERGENIVITDQEFPSNRIVWESLRPRGVEVRRARLDEAPSPEEAVLKAVDERTRLVSVSAVQYGSGLRIDLDTIGAHCRRNGILFCVDAIQSLGALPFDVRQSQADFVMADGHKWMLGPEGVALFYCREAVMDCLELHQYGWHMVERAGDFERLDWEIATSARRFECGSPNMLGIHALNASLGLIHAIGMDTIAHNIYINTQYIIDFIQDNKHYSLLTPAEPQRRAGIVTFRSSVEAQGELFNRLRSAGVVCAQRGGGIRFSPHFYTSYAALDKALAVLDLD